MAEVMAPTRTVIYSPDGDRQIALAMLDIYSHPMLSPDSAHALQRGLG
jgi:hypothetical protein